MERETLSNGVASLLTGSISETESSASAGQSSVVASLNDTLTIAGSVPSPVTGTATFTVIGSLVGGASGPTADIFVQAQVNSSYGTYSLYAFQTQGGCSPSGTVIGTQVCFGTNAVNYTFTIPFTITNAARVFPIYFTVTSESADGGQAAVSVASAAVTLPAGLTFTSASGYFLTGSGSGATDGPLPLWALCALAAGLVGIASRRFKRFA